MGLLERLFGTGARDRGRQCISEYFAQMDVLLRDGDVASAEALLEQIVQIIEQKVFRNAHYDVALVHSRIAKIAQSLGKQRDSKYLSDTAFSEVWRHPKPSDEAFTMAAVTVATDFMEMGRKDCELGWEVLALLRFDRAGRLYSLALGPDHLNVRQAVEEIDGLYQAAITGLTSSATADQKRKSASSLKRLLTERVPKRTHSLYRDIEHSLVEAEKDRDSRVREEAETCLRLLRSARD